MPYDSTQRVYDPAEISPNARGIIFYAGSRRRFVPYGWLVFAEVNADATELQFHYTHCTVIVMGRNLDPLFKWAADSTLAGVRESSALTRLGPVVERVEITEATAPEA